MIWFTSGGVENIRRFFCRLLGAVRSSWKSRVAVSRRVSYTCGVVNCLNQFDESIFLYYVHGFPVISHSFIVVVYGGPAPDTLAAKRCG